MNLDRSCAHVVPQNGAVVHLDGTVTLDGGIVPSYGGCSGTAPVKQNSATRSIVAGTASSSCNPSYGDGYQAWSYFQAPSIGGWTNFDYISAEFWVPDAPATAADLDYFWIGLLSTDSLGNADLLLQPVLQWGATNSGASWCFDNNGQCGGQYWSLTDCKIDFPNQSQTYCGPNIQVSPGDHVYVDVIETSDCVYEVDWSDYPPGGGYSYWTDYFSTDCNQFSAAIPAALEVHGLDSCNQLPAQENMWFTNISMYASGPDWNSFNYVGSDPSQWWNDYLPSPLLDFNLIVPCQYYVTNGDFGGNYGLSSYIQWNTSLCPP